MKAFLLAAALLMSGPVVSQAQPMSLAPVGQGALDGPSLVQQVDYACGPGWRQTRYGDCVPRRGPPPDRYYRPPPHDWGWAPPPPRYRPPPPPQWGWGPPPRDYHRPPPRGDWGPPPRW